MRIAIVVPELHKRSGTERCFAALARALARRGHEIVVFANRFDPGAVPDARWWRVPRVSRPHLARFCSSVLIGGIVRWLAWLRGERWDVLVSSGPDAPHADVVVFHCSCAAIMQQLRAEPAKGLHYLRNRINIASYGIFAGLVRYVLRRDTGRPLAVSATLKRDLMAESGVAPERIAVVPNGVDVDEFRPGGPGQRVRAELDVEQDARVVLFVGHNWRRKGLSTAIEALEAVRRLRPELKLRLLVAGGAASPKCFLAQALSYPVSWLGTRDDMAQVYAAADVCVLPSALESFGLPVLEAMACGIPAIVSATAGVAEISEGGGMIKLDDASDAAELAGKLLPLLESSELCRRLGENARRIAERHSWEVVAEKFEAVCREAIAQRAGGRNAAAAVAPGGSRASARHPSPESGEVASRRG